MGRSLLCRSATALDFYDGLAHAPPYFPTSF